VISVTYQRRDSLAARFRAGSRQNRLACPVTQVGVDMDDSGISRLLL
jgi:hypothetical protein